jgi:hypothetical protein
MPTRIVEGRKAPDFSLEDAARVADAAKHPAQVLEQIRGEAPAGK